MTASSRYVSIVAAVEAEFERNRQLHGPRMHCEAGCTECCHQQFHITSLDAERIASGLQDLDTDQRILLQDRARNYLHGIASGAARLPCPALDGGICSIYSFRPVICRKFGMPLYDPDRPDRIFACELNFREGEEIVDPDLIRIQTVIQREWKALQQEHGTANPTTIAGAIVSAST